MAAPTYTTDLSTYNAATVITGWTELTAYNGAGGPGVDTDLAIHGSACITMDRAKTTRDNSIVYDGTAPTIPANGGFFIWHKFFAPNSLNTLLQGGVRIYVGSTTTNYLGWNIRGNDNYQYGGWENYVVDPTEPVSADETAGTGVGDNSLVGFSWNLLAAPQKGNPFNVDIIRYGRGTAQFTNGDSTNGYATFDGFALVNDHPTEANYGRSGLFQDIGGGTYLWKGVMSLGVAATAVDFRDSNVNITLDDTTLVSESFNRVEIHHTDSTVDWTSIQITKVGTISRGEFEVVDDAVVNLDGCVFTDMSTFIFQSNSTVDNTTFRRCGRVTTGTGAFDSCVFDESDGTTAVITANLSEISNCEFISDGTSGYAVELTSLGTGTMAWDNNDSGYAATDGTTGLETIHVDATSGSLTINVTAGYSTPTIHSEGATVTVVAGQVTTTITAVDVATSGLIGDARVYLYADGTSGPLSAGTVIFNDLTDSTTGQVSDTRALASDQPVAGWIRKGTSTPLYQTAAISATIDSATGLDLTVQMIADE